MTTPMLTRDSDHVYRAGDVELPSVTQVIRAAGLMGDTSHYTDEARDRGTAIHLALEYFDQGNLDEDALDPMLRPYLDAYRCFCRDYQPTWTLVEAMRYDSTLRYAGTIDRAGRLKGEKYPYVVDIKSGGPASWHGIQTAAYKLLVRADLDSPIVARAGLYVKPDGRYTLVRHPLVDTEEWGVFLGALQTHHWKRRYLR